jgi:hypothetical protein
MQVYIQRKPSNQLLACAVALRIDLTCMKHRGPGAQISVSTFSKCAADAFGSVTFISTCMHSIKSHQIAQFKQEEVQNMLERHPASQS